MINKIISGSSLVLVIGLGIYSYLQDLQTEQQIKTFMSVGPRFTGKQGQELCLVVAELAKNSYGYRASGKPVPTCNYYGEENKNELK